MSSKAVEPLGKVLQGDYAGNNVYVYEPNISLCFVDGIYDKGLFAAPYEIKLIVNSSNVKRYEVITTYQETGMTDVALGAAIFFAGKKVAQSMANAVQVNRYKVAIYFNDGKKSLVDINNDAYSTLTTACFTF